MKRTALFLMVLLTGALLFAGDEPAATETETTPAPQTAEVVPEEGAELLVWADSNSMEFTQAAAEMFTAETGVPVTVEEVSVLASGGRLEIDGPTGIGADVLQITHNSLGSLLSAGLVMENLVSADRIRDEFMAGAVTAASSPEGVLYGWPTSLDTYLIFYNTDLVSEPPETLDELIEIGRPLTDVAQNKYGIVFQPGLYFAHAFFGATGGYVFGNDGFDVNDIGLNSAGTVAGIEEMLRLKEVSLQNAEDMTNQVLNGLFQDGRAGMMISGVWSFGALDAAGINYDVTPLPTIQGNPATPFAGYLLLVVSTYSEYPRAAQLFADYLSSEEMHLMRYETHGSIPPHKGLVQVPEVANDPKVGAFLAQAQSAKPMPIVTELNFTWAPFQSAVNDIWNGKGDAQVLLDNAAQVVADQIEAQ